MLGKCQSQQLWNESLSKSESWIALVITTEFEEHDFVSCSYQEVLKSPKKTNIPILKNG